MLVNFYLVYSGENNQFHWEEDEQRTIQKIKFRSLWSCLPLTVARVEQNNSAANENIKTETLSLAPLHCNTNSIRARGLRAFTCSVTLNVLCVAYDLCTCWRGHVCQRAVRRIRDCPLGVAARSNYSTRASHYERRYFSRVLSGASADGARDRTGVRRSPCWRQSHPLFPRK